MFVGALRPQGIRQNVIDNSSYLKTHHIQIYICLKSCSYFFSLAGAGGFEPPNAATKKRCLTAWPRPNTHTLFSLTNRFCNDYIVLARQVHHLGWSFLILVTALFAVASSL